MIYKRIVLLILLLGITAVIAACGGSEADQEPKTVEVTRVVIEEEPAGEAPEEPAEEEATNEEMEEAAETIEEPPMSTGSEGLGDEPPPPETGSKVKATRVGTEIAAVEAPVFEEVEGVRSESEPERVTTSTSDGADEAAATVKEETTDSSLSLDQNSRLTAGEVDDNADWDDYVQYLRAYQGAAVMRVDVSERHQIWVQDSQGNPALSAVIEIEAAGQPITTLRTHSNGRAYFFPRAFGEGQQDYTVHVTINNQTETFTIPAGTSQREWIVSHTGADVLQSEVKLDVLFLIDATGSMADEINQLKENIHAISARIDTFPSQPNVRFGMVTYRDQGDSYVTQVTDFTPKVEDFATVLNDVRADGGGDYPEDLNKALSQAVHQPEWRVADTVSLIFLVADAPPHLDYNQQNHYAHEMLQAATRGIKIYPIASSGLDEQGEYIFRQLAQTTGGRFIFLTYGEDGPGSTGTETEFNVSDYTVSALDDMVIKIIEEELAPLNR